MLIETVLERKRAKAGVRLTVKTAVAALVVALAVALPQIVHLVAGASGGVRWLPMYAPILLGGCLLAMPAAARLPYMIAELAVFAAVSGAFSKLIVRNAWAAFPAVLLAEVAGRAVFLTLAAIFQGVSSLDAATVWSQSQSGLLGMVLQAVVVPAIVIALRAALLSDSKKSE